MKSTLTGAFLVTMAAATVAPLPVRGQFAQYTQPGAVSGAGPELTREAFEAALAEAPWHLGSVRVDPWFGLSDLSWSANPLGTTEGMDPEGDLTASAGAGLRAHLPTGHSLFWTAHALPEYRWWAEQDGRNRLNGRYGAGVFGFFNRMTLEASGRRQEELAVVSAELPQEVNGRQDVFRLAGEVHLGFATSVFAAVSESRARVALKPEERAAVGELRALDRNERALRTGLRYRPRERWSLALGVEWTEADSVGTRDLSSSGTAPVAEVRYTGPKFWASGAAAFRSLEAEEGSEFRDTDTETYSVELGIEGNRLSPTVYARRSLALAVSEEFSHFTVDTFGASVAMALGYRTQVRAFGEVGENEFAAREEIGALRRVDDVTSYGVDLSFGITRGLAVRVGGYRTELESNLPGNDRILEVLTSGITLGVGGLERGAGSGWL